MDTNIQDRTLLNSNEQYENMIRLIILKQAAAWMEKQEWFANPYGGQNPMQDLIFQTQLTANRIWEEFFSKKMDPYSAEELKRQLLELGDLTPELQSYFEEKLKSRLPSTF